MKKVFIFLILACFIFPITREFEVGSRVFTLRIGPGGAKLFEGGILVKRGGEDSYYIYPFECSGELKTLELRYSKENYTLLLDSEPLISSTDELYSPRAICFRGKLYIVVGMGRELLLIQAGKFEKIPNFLGVEIKPEFKIENGELILEFRELWKGKEILREEKIPLRQRMKRLKSPPTFPSSPFWYNYQVNPNKYIAFGDSITYGCGYGTCEHDPPIGYPFRLEKLLKENIGNSSVSNCGRPAETTFGGLLRLGGVLKEENARYLLLMEGTNDVVHIEYPLSATEENLRTMLLNSMEFGTFPVLATIIPRKDWFWYAPYFHKKLLDVVRLQRKLAKEYSVPLADMYKVFMDYPGGWENLLSGGNHPNIQGYKLMAQTWEDTIETIPPYPPHNLTSSTFPGFLRITWEGGKESDLAGFLLCRGIVCLDLGLKYSTDINSDELTGSFELKSYDKAENRSEGTILKFR